MTKKIYFEPAGRIHSSQWNLINYPPEGYEFIVDKSKSILLNDFFLFKTRRLWEWLTPLNLTKARFQGYFEKIPEDIDLIYAYNHPVFRKKPWVVSVEWAHVLIGRDIRHFKRFKHIIEKLLASDYCKGILVWTEWAKKSVLLNFDCTDFEHKIEIVPQAVPAKHFVKDYNKEKIKLLFVGSVNVPAGFDAKGGKEVLEAFTILNQKYRNLELVIRDRIPSHVKHKYDRVLSLPNVKIIQEIQSWEALEKEFINADIFLYPTHELHNTVILDAMSYELPVITTQIGSTGRIENKVEGFIIKNSERVPYFWNKDDLNLITSGDTPQRHEFQKAIQNYVDPKVVEEIVEKTSILIENSELRRKMGKAARWEIERGRHSIEKRNEKLKKIFEQVEFFR